MTINALVVDDEAPARERVRALLAREPDVVVVGVCRNGPEAVVAVENVHPDLLLLDVQMPEMDGFEVLRALLPGALPATIFVTAYDEHALRAFDVHAVDYLLKPVDAERFAQAIDRARSRLRSSARTAVQDFQELLSSLAQQPPWLERLVIRETGRISLLPVADVDWIEAADNYVRVHTGKTALIMRATLKDLEQRLDPARFARVHRSAIVAIDRIVQLEPLSHGDFTIVLRTGARVTASRSYELSIRRILGV